MSLSCSYQPSKLQICSFWWFCSFFHEWCDLSLKTLSSCHQHFYCLISSTLFNGAFTLMKDLAHCAFLPIIFRMRGSLASSLASSWLSLPIWVKYCEMSHDVLLPLRKFPVDPQSNLQSALYLPCESEQVNLIGSSPLQTPHCHCEVVAKKSKPMSWHCCPHFGSHFQRCHSFRVHCHRVSFTSRHCQTTSATLPRLHGSYCCTFTNCSSHHLRRPLANSTAFKQAATSQHFWVRRPARYCSSVVNCFIDLSYYYRIPCTVVVSLA